MNPNATLPYPPPRRAPARDVRLIGTAAVPQHRVPSCNACLRIAARRDVEIGYETELGKVVAFTHLGGEAYVTFERDGQLSFIPLTEVVKHREAVYASFSLTGLEA